MRFAKSFRLAVGIATWVLTSTNLPAAQTNVAVAANFTEAAKEIAAAFKAKTGHEAVLSFGATGQFYTQITQGAPFQILLSADAARPKKLVEDGLAVSGSHFTYAIGKLVLWSTMVDGTFSDRQVHVVLAHEIGHHSSHHIPKGLAWFGLFALPAAWLLMRATRRRGGCRPPASRI